DELSDTSRHPPFPDTPLPSLTHCTCAPGHLLDHLAAAREQPRPSAIRTRDFLLDHRIRLHCLVGFTSLLTGIEPTQGNLSQERRLSIQRHRGQVDTRR